MRHVIDVDLVAFERSVQLHRLEKVVSAGAGKQRETVRGGPQLRRQVLLDPFDVLNETGVCRRLRCKRLGSGVKLLPYEGRKVVPAWSSDCVFRYRLITGSVVGVKAARVSICSASKLGIV